ncbi:MAG: aspartyl protease family protein [Candidatus Midichloriaceae bacterium]|jgi:aspartyl protease family protein
MNKKGLSIILIVGLIIYFLINKYGIISFKSDMLPNIIYFLVILIVLIINIFNSNISFGKLLKYSTIWILIFSGLLIGVSYQKDLSKIIEKVKANIIPGTVIKKEDKVVQIIASNNEHYFAYTIVNGESIKFLIDTGATDVSLTRSDAKKLGVPLDQLQYTKQAYTANGLVRYAPIKLSYIKLGDIIVYDVSASVGEYDKLDTSLL